MNSYVKIRITGRNVKLFLKRFFINKINYDKYKEIDYKNVELRISYEDYLKIREISSIYEVRLVRFYGPVKYAYFLKKNLSFIICFIIMMVLLYVISNTTFNITVVHNDKEIRKLVSEELYDRGIKPFTLIPGFKSRKRIIDEIIESNKDKLEWMEIERTGNKLTVKVTERKTNKKEEVLPNRHIIAKKSGVIMKIEAQEGVVVKKANDYVNKGDVIVSGDIIKDETVKGQVAAKGLVYAETWYQVNVEYPLYYEEITYLDEVKNNYIISFLNKDFAIKKNYTESYLEKKRTLISDKLFLFSVSMEKQRKIKIKKETLSSEKAIKKAEEIALKKINTKLDKDEYVISKKTLNFSLKDSKIVIDVFFKVCENITDYQEADPSLLENPEETE